MWEAQDKECAACGTTLHVLENAIEIQCTCGAVWDVNWNGGNPQLLDTGFDQFDVVGDDE